MRTTWWSGAVLGVALAACAGELPEGGGPGPDGAPGGDGAGGIDLALAALSPDDAFVVPADVSNAVGDDPAAARFGQRLFFDPSFSGPLLDTDNDGTGGALGYVGETGKVSCASCHVPDAGFLDDRSHGQQISLAAGWGKRRAPSLLGVGHARVLMWDGRHDTAYNQVFGALESVVEMNGSRLFAAVQAFRLHRAEYEAIFGAMPPLDDTTRFPALAAAQAGCESLAPGAVCHGRPGDPEHDAMSAADEEAVTRVVVNLAKAIAAYERRLDCGPGRFDAWVHGDATALSAEEQAGAALFVGKAGCVACHGGPRLTDERFHNVGLSPAPVSYGFVDVDDPGASVGLAAAIADPLNVEGVFSDSDDGRLPASVDEGSMLGAFRTPSLRCVSSRPSFMHTGQIRSLEGVVAFFDEGGHASGFLGRSVIAPLGLTAEERAALVAFLRTLDGAGPPAELMGPPAE